MHEIEFSPSSLEDLRSLRKPDQRQILNGIETQPRHEPTTEARNRKRLRPNELAAWELRICKFRVFYDVNNEERVVSIVAIGLKIGNLLFIRGEQTKL